MKRRPFFLTAAPLSGCVVCCLAFPALAQDVPPPALPSTPPPRLEVPDAPPPPPPSELDVPLAPPPPEPGLLPEPVKDDFNGINIGVWGRMDVLLNNGDKLDDIGSTGLAELHTSGKLTDDFNFTMNLVAAYGSGDIAGSAGLLDAILQFDPDDAFHLWLGRMLVPVDRSNFSGPWFMAPWYYPLFGFVDGQIGPTVPHEGPSGRNDGATMWGFYAQDEFSIKYYLGAYDLHNSGESPLISGRLNLSVLNPEPGYYSNSTYYGKDILALGAGFQYKKNGSSAAWQAGAPAAVGDYTEFNVDLLFEKKLGESVLNLEGAFYKFNGDYERTDMAWFGLASLLLPGGTVQPLVRVQQALPAYDFDETSTLVDAQLGYVLNAFATRFAAGYRYGKAGDLTSHALFFGAQFQK